MKLGDLNTYFLISPYCRNLFDNKFTKKHLYEIIEKTSPYYDEEKTKLFDSKEWKYNLIHTSDEERKVLKSKKDKYKSQLKKYCKEKKKTVFKVLKCLNININKYKNKKGKFEIPLLLEKLIEVICYEDSDKKSLVSKITCDEDHKLSYYEILYFMKKVLKRVKEDLDNNNIFVNSHNDGTDAFLSLNTNLPLNIDDLRNKVNLVLEENNYLLQIQEKIKEIKKDLQIISNMLYLPVIQTNDILENLYIIFESKNPYANYKEKNTIKRKVKIEIGNNIHEIEGIIPNTYNEKEELTKYDDYLEKIQQNVNDFKNTIEEFSII